MPTIGTCTRCGASDATIHSNGYCRACSAAYKAQQRRQGKVKYPTVCTRCGEAARADLKVYTNGYCRLCWSSYMRPYTDRNRDKINERNRRYMSERTKKERAAVIAAYGAKCACCGEVHVEFLAIDHINGGGLAERKASGTSGSIAFYMWLRKANYPEGLQILCHNCNQSFGIYGYCPHGNLPSRAVRQRGTLRSTRVLK